jgi:hypothetical protein
MKEIIAIPVVAIMILGFVPQLLSVAESSQAKAISFADDMNNAIDCATRGVALEVCSPNLMDHDFSPELNQTLSISQDMLKQLQHQNYNSTNATVIYVDG